MCDDGTCANFEDEPMQLTDHLNIYLPRPEACLVGSFQELAELIQQHGIPVPSDVMGRILHGAQRERDLTHELGSLLGEAFFQ